MLCIAIVSLVSFNFVKSASWQYRGRTSGVQEIKVGFLSVYIRLTPSWESQRVDVESLACNVV